VQVEHIGSPPAPSTARVHELARRWGDCPKPVVERPKAKLWVWDDVAKWAKRTGRLP
jgi:hypothetical protein